MLPRVSCRMENRYNFTLVNFKVPVFYFSERLRYSLKVQTFGYYRHNDIPIIAFNLHIRENLGLVILCTRSISAYPETSLNVLSVFLLSHLFTAQFPLPYVVTGTITIDLETQFSFILHIPLLACSEFWRKPMVTFQDMKKLHGQNM
jgi:hypothetical protein